MIQRYENQEIVRIWTDEHTLLLWQKTELAAIKARVQLGELEDEIYHQLEAILQETPIDLEWWRKRDKEIHHDLNAFLDERIRHLPSKFHEYFHRKMTSFDTQEPAFAAKLNDSIQVIGELYARVESALIELARRYRFTIMNARTHGQEAELQTFGKRCLTWLKQLREADNAGRILKYSKLSGAIGNYGSIDPVLERKALEILGYEPFYGATQIIPRIVYLPVAQRLCGLVQVLNNIALDIRLGARSGRPLMREPFKKKQKGSSAMPHKKNPIRCEQLKGMERMARNFLHMIEENVETWEERAIEQSSVERIGWPDLFHVTARALSEMAYILEELQVYEFNMLLEVHESRGVYASSEVKEFLKERMAALGFAYEDAYRVVQLACFNVFELGGDLRQLMTSFTSGFTEAKERLNLVGSRPALPVISIQEFIPGHQLFPIDDLDITSEQVGIYNECLQRIFTEGNHARTREEWDKLFNPAELLKNEAVLYREIIGE